MLLPSRIAAALLTLTLGVGTPAAALAAPLAAAPLRAEASQSTNLAIDVPYVSQLARTSQGAKVGVYACGPASAAMAAAYYTGGAPQLGRAEALTGGSSLIGDGSQPWQVAQTIRLLAPGVRADAAAAPNVDVAWSLLQRETAAGRPLITMVHPSWFATPINHFVVVTGVADSGKIVRFNDPLAGRNVQIGTDAFLQAWRAPRDARPFTYVWTSGPVAVRGSDGQAQDASRPLSQAESVVNGVEQPAPTERGTVAVGSLAVVTATSLRVHADASAASPAVAYLAHNAEVTVRDLQDGWALLRWAGGQGWADSAFLARA